MHVSGGSIPPVYTHSGWPCLCQRPVGFGPSLLKRTWLTACSFSAGCDIAIACFHWRGAALLLRLGALMLVMSRLATIEALVSAFSASFAAFLCSRASLLFPAESAARASASNFSPFAASVRAFANSAEADARPSGAVLTHFAPWRFERSGGDSSGTLENGTYSGSAGFAGAADPAAIIWLPKYPTAIRATTASAPPTGNPVFALLDARGRRATGSLGSIGIRPKGYDEKAKTRRFARA